LYARRRARAGQPGGRRHRRSLLIRAPPLLTTGEEKRAILATSAVDRVAFVPFTQDLRSYPPERFVREVLGLPLFTWTVRTAQDRAVAARWADAITFEGFEP
ncbi:MAG: hypothetical protein HC869_24120, partial [Rhodospirillales bacterium]|nr:hypothetical protein [Rhodospirillales bacterium]